AADFAGQLMAPSRATFHSLLAVFLSGLAPWNWPEVRKDRNEEPYRSTGYARTNQAVGLQHWQAEGTGSGQGTGHLARSGTWGPGSRGFQAAARFNAASKATRSRSTMVGKGSRASSFFLMNACHRACREGSCANSSVRPTGNPAGTAMPRRSKVALIAWASRSVSRVSRSSNTDRSR